MAKQSRNTLKGYFETGDIPTGANYVDLIDTPLMLNTENTGSAAILGSMTASGGISASKIVTPIVENSNTTVGLTLTGNITASGNISSSGTISAENFILGSAGAIFVQDDSGNTDDIAIANIADAGILFGDADMPSSIRSTTIGLDASSTITLDSDSGLVEFKDGGAASTIQFNTSVGHITASGDISASGTISAFGSSSLVGLPTTEPSITGALWLSGSGGGSASGSKYLMVFTG